MVKLTDAVFYLSISNVPKMEKDEVLLNKEMS
jgi:hypothetical protein